jgi:hypothetical protein
MDRLKSFPLTPALLLLLLIATIANYLEVRRMERSIGSLYVAILETDHDTKDGLEELDKSVDRLNDITDQMSDVQECMAYHRPPCTRTFGAP